MGPDACFDSLSRKQRYIAFAILFILGCFLLWVSPVALDNGNVDTFGVFYTFGHILITTSGFFLWGPKAQWEGMFKEHRYVAATVYLGSLVATVLVIFIDPNKLLILIFIAIQFCA